MPSNFRAVRHQSRLIVLAVLLAALALAASITGITLLRSGPSAGASFEVAKWCLQLATVFAGAGVISAVLRQAEISRIQRDSWAILLQELVASADVVQLAGRLLAAHATAKTYSEQIARVSEVRGTLRRITNSPQVHEEPVLRDAVHAMRRFLKLLVQEYEAKYLPVARQQRLDEAVLTARLKDIAENSDPTTMPILPPELAAPLPAGRALSDAAEFPLLTEFRTNYKESEFWRAYERAKPILERRAKIRRAVDKGVPAVTI